VSTSAIQMKGRAIQNRIRQRNEYQGRSGGSLVLWLIVRYWRKIVFLGNSSQLVGLPPVLAAVVWGLLNTV